MNTSFNPVVNEMHSCRCCLLRPPEKDMKTPYTHLGKTEIYSDMIQECFDLHLTLGGDGQCGICEVCVGRLRDASDFKLQVQHSQLQLQGALQVKYGSVTVKIEYDDDDQPMSDATSNPQNIGSVPVKIEYDDDQPMCDANSNPHNIGGVTIDKSENIEETTGAETSRQDPLMFQEGGDRIEWALAVPSTSAENALRVHTRGGIYFCHIGEVTQRFTEKPGLINHIQEQVKLVELRTFSCETCSTYFSSVTDLVDHILKHKTKKTYTCDVCNMTLASLKNFIKHVENHKKNGNEVQKKENKNTPVTCDICNKTVRKGYLEMHKRIHTGEKPYACGECGMKFSLAQSLEGHKLVHSSERPFACSQCDKRFKKKSLLKIHTTSHTGEKPYSCTLCDKSFTTSSGLQAHKNIHTGKTYTCEICNRQFNQKVTLLNHQSVHTGYKPHNCEECNKKFTTKWDLERHRRTHSGNKPYACDVCDKRFSRLPHLTGHKLIHSGDKPYVCDQCSARFTQKAYLDQHKRIHSGEKPFKCETCNKTFRQLSACKRHERVHTEQGNVLGPTLTEADYPERPPVSNEIV